LKNSSPIEDISEFVSEQHEKVISQDFVRLVTPREEVYPVANPEVASRLDIDCNH
jgi:hypothetical protein